jgi:hypothetical protein
LGAAKGLTSSHVGYSRCRDEHGRAETASMVHEVLAMKSSQPARDWTFHEACPSNDDAAWYPSAVAPSRASLPMALPLNRAAQVHPSVPIVRRRITPAADSNSAPFPD